MTIDLSGCLLRAKAVAFSSLLRGASRRSASILAGLLLLPLNGCLGHHYVKTDFKSYENAFAETSNRELLLNLARLDQRAPAYFFKMGQITSSYRMQGSLTTNGQLNAVTSPEGQVPVGGGSPGVIFENDPTFQFIPVNDDTNARLLISPIQPETFYALYQQGWRLDQLFRLLVDRIEVSIPIPQKQGGKNECEVEIFRNVPPEGRSYDGQLAAGQQMAPVNVDGSLAGYYVYNTVHTASGDVQVPVYSITADQKTRYDAVALSHYVTFLRVSALMYELQKNGLLVLRGNDSFVPYDAKAVIDAAAGKSSPPANAGTETPSSPGSGGSGGSAFQAKDQNDAVARNDIWHKSPQGWVLGRMVFTPVFYLTPIVEQTTNGVTTISSDTDQVKQELASDLSDPNLSALNPEGSTALNRVLEVMKGGFSLEGMPNAQGDTQQNVCPAIPTAHLYMRSIIELMASSAQEQVPFDALAKADPPVTRDPQDPQDQSTPQSFTRDVPRLEQMPVLRLQWKGLSTIGPPLVEVSLNKTTYSVNDLAPSPIGSKEAWIEANANWNRDMFRLIEGLSSQVTVDISKFPLPEILQLHSD